MELKPKYPIQSGGMRHLWRSPDGSFKLTLTRLDSECEPDKYPGVVIIADENYEHTFATAVKNLQKELPALLKQIDGKPVAYWWLEDDQKEVKRILVGLTEHPVFADHR